MHFRLIRLGCSAFCLVVGSVALAGCGGKAVDSGGLTVSEWNAAQSALNLLQDSNIPTQLLHLTATASLPPAACQVHLESTHPRTFKVYIFWIPYMEPQSAPHLSYSWMTMSIGSNTAEDTFHLGTDTPLSRYGARQAQRNKQVLKTHAGDTFAKPRARCELLKNGYLRLVPNSS